MISSVSIICILEYLLPWDEEGVGEGGNCSDWLRLIGVRYTVTLSLIFARYLLVYCTLKTDNPKYHKLSQSDGLHSTLPWPRLRVVNKFIS